MQQNIIIAGIHTGIGKTVCSTIICQALGFDYWKPIQAGDLENSDTIFVQKNTNNSLTTFHQERYRLATAMSPHKAAAIDGVSIKKEDFVLPKTSNNMLVETAGGIMSPINTNFLVVDLIQYLQLPVVLVSNNYLGSINHTLLTIEALNNRKIPINGIVFCGETVPSSQSFITAHTQIPILFAIPQFDNINTKTIVDFTHKTNIKTSNN
jgi:dethiobiotin synthetase